MSKLPSAETPQRADRSGRPAAVGVIRGVGTAITDADDAFLAMVGWSRAAFARGLMDWAAMTPPEYLPLDAAGIAQAMETGGFTVPYQKEFYRRDGSRVAVLLACAFVPGTEGAWIGYVVDLSATEARHAEPLDATRPLTEAALPALVFERLIAELVRERGRMVRMLDGADALIWAVDPELRLLAANAAFQDAQRAQGGAAMAIGDAVVSDRVPAPLRGQWERAYAAALAGERHTLRTSVAHADGERHFESRLNPMHAPDGTLLGVAVVSRDVTAQHRAAEALRASEERYALAARATRNAIWEVRFETDDVVWSSGLTAIFGHPHGVRPQAFVWWLAQVHPEDRERVAEGIRAVIEAPDGATDWQDTYRFRRADGGWAHVLDRGFVVRDADGRAQRMIGAMEDVTQQRELEERLRHAQKMEAVGQLAGGIAHDFNNLLTVIHGSLEFALAALPPAHAAREDLDEIAGATERARTLVRQLLTFSRKQRVQPRLVAVGDVVHGMERLLRRVIGEEIALEVLVDAATPAVLIDPGQLEQVVMNLVVNARDAMLTPRHGHAGTGGALAVEVTTRVLREDEVREWGAPSGGPHVELVVRDTGHGIDAETLARLFEPFFTTKDVGAGTGLGLATVHGIVQEAGGVVRVESEPGGGTTFTVLLPAAADTSERPQPPAAPSGAAEPAAATVLLVEDEAPVRAMVRRTLERRGHTVLEARHGADALLLWQRHAARIDLVVTDARMPEVGGRDLVARLRRERPALPVVYVSGYAEPEVGAQLGARDRFVEKPFSAEQLLQAVHALLAPPAP